ncbi:unnamed protein product, partial [Mesorhabditis spiculigera]
MNTAARRTIHISATLARGRNTYFEKHKLVTDPAKQDPNYFEDLARKLPLDDNYIDQLKMIYTDKVMSERDLTMKASDNLIADKVTYGLPQLDMTAPRPPYTNVDALKDAPESVKKIFSLDFGTRRDLTSEWKRVMIEQVNHHALDNASHEKKIALCTALIRHWSMIVDDIFRKNVRPRKPTWLTHRIWLVIGQRRRLLRELREIDEEAFQKVIKELKIAYHVQKQPEHVKTRKAWSEAQLLMRVKEEKEKKLEDLHQRYIKELEEKKDEMKAKREKLEKERQEIEKRMKDLLILEGKVTENVVGEYKMPLVGQFTEAINHAQLFYHPKPDMVRNQ